MDYFILTGTEFFLFLSKPDKDHDYEKAYNVFVRTAFDLCVKCSEPKQLPLAIAYTEVELQYLYERDYDTDTKSDKRCLYLRKALSFIHKIAKQLTIQAPQPISSNNQKKKHPSDQQLYQWTSNTVELVEIIYGLVEMGCFNNGDAPINELATFVGRLFGVEIKDCYHTYIDIKRRKNGSRTYFLDKMRERLNKRMELDDLKEMKRR